MFGITENEEQKILSPHPQIPHIDICRHIYTGQVTDMNGTVRIRQRTGHKRSVEFLFHYDVTVNIFQISPIRKFTKIYYTLPSSLLRRVRALLNSPIRVISST